MNTRWWLAFVALVLACIPARAVESGPVVVIPIKTEISSAQFFFLRRALKEAERDGASAFVIDMSTYGGEVKAAIDNMDALLKTRVPTYTYINPRAISAGALIALSTKNIYMAPNAVIGAAAPVLSTGDDLPKTMTDKTISALSAMARAASQQNGHNPDLADAFISKNKEVKIGEQVIHKSDSLLTLSAQEAARKIDGKPLLAAGIAPSLDDMFQQAGLKSPVRYVEPTGFERAAFWITTLAPLLLLGGIVGAYIEFKTPGFGLPGIISIICFTCFFAGHYLAGLAGWEVFAAFIIGITLVLMELFLHPGTIVPGVIGMVLMVGSLIWAMIDRWPSESWWPTSEMLVRPLVNLGLAAVAGFVAIYLLAKILPKTSFYQRIVLTAAEPSGPGVSIPLERTRLTAGEAGRARTTLRPAGKAEFGENIYDVVSRGEFIEAGKAVRVVAVDGTRVVVAPAQGSA